MNGWSVPVGSLQEPGQKVAAGRKFAVFLLVVCYRLSFRSFSLPCDEQRGPMRAVASLFPSFNVFVGSAVGRLSHPVYSMESAYCFPWVLPTDFAVGCRSQRTSARVQHSSQRPLFPFQTQKSTPSAGEEIARLEQGAATEKQARNPACRPWVLFATLRLFEVRLSSVEFYLTSRFPGFFCSLNNSDQNTRGGHDLSPCWEPALGGGVGGVQPSIFDRRWDGWYGGVPWPDSTNSSTSSWA